MRRHLALAALALTALACSEQATAPSARDLTPRRLVAGDPPPPPLTGTGDGSFSATDAAVTGSAAPQLAICSASLSSFIIDWKYFINRPEKSAWIHVDQPQFNGHSDFHSTDKKNDASGQIVGPDFTFKINDVVAGSVFNEARRPGSFDFQVTGLLTLANGTKCNATGNIFLRLVSGD